jgi:predicted GNAT superfamily acetyltransferase
MSSTIQAIDSARMAADAAEAAAVRSGIDVRVLSDLPAIQRAVELFGSIWGPQDRDLIGVSTLRALAHSGNYLVGAYLDGEMVGAITGFLGWHGASLQLHSHILGVSATAQGHNVGFALKQHQRAWALGKGIGTVTWTFDPLVSRNAYFNLTKLGATVTAYYPSFYGQMNDEINGRDESDRVLIEWELTSTRAVAAGVGKLVSPHLDSLLEAGAVVALEVGADDMPIERSVTSDRILVGVPRDIVELRKTDPQSARRWRFAVREVLEGALNDGFVISSMTRSGYYVLEKIS